MFLFPKEPRIAVWNNGSDTVVSGMKAHLLLLVEIRSYNLVIEDCSAPRSKENISPFIVGITVYQERERSKSWWNFALAPNDTCCTLVFWFQNSNYHCCTLKWIYPATDQYIYLLTNLFVHMNAPVSRFACKCSLPESQHSLTIVNQKHNKMQWAG